MKLLRHCWWACALTCGASSAVAAGPSAAVPIAAQAVVADVLPAPRVLLGKVVVRTDVTYTTLPGFRPLRLDLYQPEARAAMPRPLVVFVHGGSWTVGHKRATAAYADFPGVLAGLAQRGYVVASVEYRLSGEAPFPAAVQDVKAAVRFLRTRHAQFGIDPARLLMWGASAGAHLASMVAYTCDVPALAPVDPALAAASDCAQGFVGWYGPYDVQQMLRDAAAAAAAPGTGAPSSNVETEGSLRFLKCTATGCPEDVSALASTVKHVDPLDPPALLIHGTADTVVPHAQTARMAEAIRAGGAQVEVISIPGANHGWIGVDAAATAAASRQALAATLAYIDKVLKPPR